MAQLKKIIVSLGLSFVLSIFVSTGLKAQLQWQNPIPTGCTLNSNCFTDSLTGFAVGAFGTIMKTTDGGLHWIQKLVGTTADLFSVFFTDSEHGYAGGKSDSFLKTDNGGETWFSPATNPQCNIQSIFFITQDLGIVAGGGKVYRTTDGGTNWEIKLQQQDDYYQSICFINDSAGFIVGYYSNGNLTYGILIKTTDAGNTWTRTPMDDNISLWVVHFVNCNEGYIGGDNKIYKTIDSGNTWTQLQCNGTINSIAHFNDSTLVASYDWGSIIRSANKGENWNEVFSNNGQTIYSLASCDNKCFAIGGNYYTGAFTLKSDDTGNNWLTLSGGMVNDLFSISFFDANNGFAVGRDAGTLHTCDGGQNWAFKRCTNLILKLWSVDCTNPSTAYVTGQNGFIFKTIDSGNTWNMIKNYSSYDLYSIQFVNEIEGYVAGSDGTILKTTDSGNSWTTLNSGTTETLESVFFLNSNLGYTTGSNGTILKTSDGGNTWQQMNSGTNLDIRSVFFLNQDIGFAAGNGSYLLKTIDGGITWNPIHYGDGPCFSVWFTDEDHGYLACAGRIIYSIDRGTTWKSYYIGPPLKLWDIEFTNNNTCYIAGEHGTILYGNNIDSLFTSTVQKKERSDQKYMIFPNPAIDYITIELSGIQSEISSVELLNLNGIIIAQKKFSHNNFTNLDIRTIPNGIYLLRIISTKCIETHKLIIQR